MTSDEHVEAGEAPVTSTSQMSLLQVYLCLLTRWQPCEGTSYMDADKLRARLYALLPFSTAAQLFGVLIFLIVELSGAAGGTSGVAGTRSVALFLMYWLLFSLSLHIGRQQGQSNLRPSVVVYLISSIVFLSTMLGSAFSTFGVEDCRVEKDAERKVLTLGPVSSLLSNSTGTFLLVNRRRCGIDSIARGVKTICEILLHLFVALPSVLAAFYGLQYDWTPHAPSPPPLPAQTATTPQEAAGTSREDAQKRRERPARETEPRGTGGREDYNEAERDRHRSGKREIMAGVNPEGSVEGERGKESRSSRKAGGGEPEHDEGGGVGFEGGKLAASRLTHTSHEAEGESIVDKALNRYLDSKE